MLACGSKPLISNDRSMLTPVDLTTTAFTALSEAHTAYADGAAAQAVVLLELKG